VLALLLTRANEVVPADSLIEELWSGEPPRTATNTLQYYVSQLRKALGNDRIVTRVPGYAVRVEPDELDLTRFERLVDQGGAERLRQALELWRGPPLADFAYEPFARSEIARLEELRLAALELRIDADLALGRHAQLVGELEGLVEVHPLRERLHGLLMLALYRAGRQAEALEAYRRLRRKLVDELGIDPGPAIQGLEKAILVQDPTLDLVRGHAELRAIVVAPRSDARLESLLLLAEPLAGSRPPREVIIAILTSADGLAGASRIANERRSELTRRGVSARAATFISTSAGNDLVRLTSEQDVDLLLLDCRPDEDVVTGELGTVLGSAPCDVGLLCGGTAPDPGPEHPIIVPFGAAEHEWTAVEVAAWIAAASGAGLMLVGSEGNPTTEERDASRLLASASLLVQRAVGVSTEPLLVKPGAAGVVTASEDAGLIVSGLAERWREEGIGLTRREIAHRARPPLLLVRRGLRPGGIAPQRAVTRFTWSIAGDPD